MDYLRGHALHEIFLNKQTVKERERKRKREKEKMLRMVWYRVGGLWYVFFFFPRESTDNCKRKRFL